jgi:hypothetical protein
MVSVHTMPVQRENFCCLPVPLVCGWDGATADVKSTHSITGHLLFYRALLVITRWKTARSIQVSTSLFTYSIWQQTVRVNLFDFQTSRWKSIHFFRSFGNRTTDVALHKIPHVVYTPRRTVVPQRRQTPTDSLFYILLFNAQRLKTSSKISLPCGRASVVTSNVFLTL